jgi:hypothetical protein
MDTGNFSFEITQIVEHITTHLFIFSNEFGGQKLILKIFLKGENEILHHKLAQEMKGLSDRVAVQIEQELNPGGYYKLVQFKFFIAHRGKEINLSDGGFVDWTQKLIPNKKHRLMISGIGTELMHKIKQNQF